MKPMNHPSIPGFSLEAEPNQRFREDQINYMEQISNGLTPREVAASRNWEYGTVRNYQSDIIDLFDARNIAEATFRAFELKVLQPREVESSPSESLDPIDLEVLKYVTQGYITPEIAALQLRGTRKVYESRRHIYKLYGVKSMTHAIRHGVEVGDLQIGDPADETT